MPKEQVPTLSIRVADGNAERAVSVVGKWQVQALAESERLLTIERQLADLPQSSQLTWDLSQITSIDHFGAQILWNAWGKTYPEQVAIPDHVVNFFKRVEQAGALAPADDSAGRRVTLASLKAAGRQIFARIANHARGFVRLIGQLMLDLMQFARAPGRGPWKEISASIFHAGYQALGITALVGFLIGVVLSYLSAQQLHTFGGDVYLVNLLGMSIIRELGPLLAAILVAGRSGSSITAQLGVMRVTEELDAMLVMGMPHGFRLIMPRVVALAIAMPLLVIWTDAMALIGGIVAANAELDLSPSYFFKSLPDAVPLANYYIGLGKGVVFGALIALVACHFGLRIKANTESLGRGTTTSVVTAITVVILADAVFAIVFNGVGFT